MSEQELKQSDHHVSSAKLYINNDTQIAQTYALLAIAAAIQEQTENQHERWAWERSNT